MAFKIKYRFKNEDSQYTCTVTYQQYKNFQEIPLVAECEIIKGNQKNVEAYQKELQKALDLASQQSITSHIKKLSENV
ncbi:hypothetical protein [Nitrosopumilus sp.]|uniref:hypothetical protein n=1 Tax=Nitrosopumilus sp. TaxID=2024843 RepID=UPI003D0C87FD